MTVKKTASKKAVEFSDAAKLNSPKKKKKSKIKEKLLKELGRRLILTDEFITSEPSNASEKTEYGVIIYYNGAYRPNM
ncbi:UNVERIFIED_ORG: hypothetical protein J2W82_000201 [Pseudomonas mohnii]|nr:hypothetical protein [Pseudomonas mohnii]